MRTTLFCGILGYVLNYLKFICLNKIPSLNMSSDSYNPDEVEFDWLKLKEDMDAAIPIETNKQKIIRKVSENPFVPIGALATTGALCYGLYSFRTGQKKMSQYMMRTRIAAQGFTVLAMVLGIGIGAKRTAGQQKAIK